MSDPEQDRCVFHGDVLMLDVIAGTSLEDAVRRAHEVCHESKLKTAVLFNGFQITIERIKPWDWMEG